ncbi:MAG: hypothetical protein Q4B68_01930 [Bacteroidales bacterium]|nr:hypothetical protein [Bacteroidales bacterium]
MAYKEERINEFFNSRGLMVVMGVVYAVVSYFAFASGRFSASVASGNGVFFNDIDRLLGHPTVSFGVNTLCVMTIVALTALLNKTYTFIREVTFIYASTFLALQLACPYACTQFTTGTGLCLLTLVVQQIMFSTYQKKKTAQQQVFLVFFLVALCGMFQYAFLALAVPFFIGFAQMRAINFRGVLAAAFGLVTPFWLAIGLGLIDPSTAMWPTGGNAIEALTAEQIPVILVGLALVGLFTFVLITVNVLKIMSYRLQLRVYNSFYLVLALFSLVMMAIDYRNFFVYLALLNYCFSIQVAQAFTIHAGVQRRYVGMILFLLSCAASHACYYFL